MSVATRQAWRKDPDGCTDHVHPYSLRKPLPGSGFGHRPDAFDGGGVAHQPGRARYTDGRENHDYLPARWRQCEPRRLQRDESVPHRRPGI